MNIISYEFFESPEELVKWQMDNKEKIIHQITPQVFSMDMDGTCCESSDDNVPVDVQMSGNIVKGVFISYSHEVEDD